jgi:predicted metal-dependent phosphoesterase TrpH
MKADLHVHSYHSGYASHLRFLRARDSYSSVFDVYRVAKSRGMDLVCLTDHDSIDGCREFLDRHPHAPDFIAGEEVSCRVPDAPGLCIHLGVYGVTDGVHAELQRLRDNVFDVAAYLRQQHILFAVNHLFLMFGGEVPLDRYVREMLALAPALETRNGAAIAADNELVGALAGDAAGGGRRHATIGGSDAHTLQWVGTTYTEAAARTREEFLAAVADGRATVGGRHATLWRTTSEIYGAIFNYWRSLAGVERHDLTAGARLGGIAFTLASLPIQWVPAIVAWRLKRRERQRVERWRRDLQARRATPVRSSAA